MELQQRCWNHEAREAACRCPACGRSYCRECVSEHEGRLLCAPCLIAITARKKPVAGGFGKLAPPGMIAAGILLAWLIYWAAGASLIGLIRRMQQEPVSAGRDDSAISEQVAEAMWGRLSTCGRLVIGQMPVVPTPFAACRYAGQVVRGTLWVRPIGNRPNAADVRRSPQARLEAEVHV